MILSFGSELFRKNAFELGQHIASQTGLLKELHDDKTPEGISRYENIQELLNGLKQFSAQDESTDQPTRTLDKFMEDVALLTDADNEKEEDKDKISLMTIHAAKGLEFSNVHVVGMEEDLFPSMMSKNSRSDLEEERRLFYVAVTRAKINLTLSYAVSRFKWGNLIQCEPSRFLEELDPKYIEHTFSIKNNKKDFNNAISKNKTSILKNKFSIN